MPTDNIPAAGAASRIAPALEWAGYACVAPLVAGLAGVGLLPDYAARELSQRGTLAWGGVVLAATGALHWGLMFAGQLRASAPAVAAAFTPALCAAAGILLGGQRGLALLTVGFGMFWLYEHRVLGAQLPPAYLDLRRHLSVAICVLLAMTMFVAEAHGLP
ncbi:MAG TPA: DUF3429 domain-containing protein [Steroidobacteraceae bacterium]